jgi:hypothetical protein
MNAREPKVSGLLFALTLSGTMARSQAEPVRLAASARFDLAASAAVARLDVGQVVEGNGSIQRPNWVSADRRPSAYTG